MNRLFSVLIASLIWFSSAPVEWIHQLFEEHEEIHHCDYDYCVRSFSHECQLDKTALTKKPVLTEPEIFVYPYCTKRTYFHLTNFFKESVKDIFNSRAPPIF